MAYEQLPMIMVDISDLLLDLDNYRIPMKPEDEAGALRYLFASEDALGAATSILRDGYFDNEVPIVLEDPRSSGRYLVLEGNRRVSALKALQDPELAVGQQQAVKRLLKRFAAEVPNLPTRIRVLVTPDRRTAEPHIARLHTTTSKKKWTRDQQATFYYSLLNGSTTVADIKAWYPGVRGIPGYIKRAAMRRFLGGVQFVDPSLRSYVVGNDLKMTVLERAYARPEIASALGISFSEDGLLEPVAKKPDVIGRELAEHHRQAVEYLVTEIRAKRLSTRSEAFKVDSPELEELVGHLIGTSSVPSPAPLIGSRSEPSSLSSSEAVPSSSSAAPATGTDASPQQQKNEEARSRGPNRPETKDKLDLSGLDYNNVPVNLKDRYIELRKLSLKEFPTTTAILLRSILETTVKHYLDVKKISSTGALKHVLATLGKTEAKNKALMASFRLIDSGDAQTPGSVGWFNMVAHSADKPVCKEDVHKAWKLVAPLLKRLLP